MKHKIKILVVALMCMLISGCSTVPQPTMEELMAEVNAEHAAVEQTEGDFSQYLRKPVHMDFMIILAGMRRSQKQSKKLLRSANRHKL